MWDHSNESYWALPVLSRGTVHYAAQGGSNFKSDKTLECDYAYKAI